MSSASKRVGDLFARPWFWILFIGAAWIIPLIKSLGAELPPPLPGLERQPLTLSLVEEARGPVSFDDLGGTLLVVRQLPLLDLERGRTALTRLHELRKRLRGLSHSVCFVMIASGGSPEQLSALLDERKVRKPQHLFLHDDQGDAWARLCAEAGQDQDCESLLLDRHARPRGGYAGDESGVDRLVRDAGQLANYLASDPPPGG